MCGAASILGRVARPPAMRKPLFFDEGLALDSGGFHMTLMSIMRQVRPAARTFDKAVRWPRPIEPRAEAVHADRHVNCVPDVIVTAHITGPDAFRDSGNIAHIVFCHR